MMVKLRRGRVIATGGFVSVQDITFWGDLGFEMMRRG
jgi:hypothetical protein